MGTPKPMVDRTFIPDLGEGDYLPLEKLSLSLEKEAAEAKGSFTLCFWLYLMKTSKGGVLIRQGRPAAATAVPFLIMTTDNRLTMYPAPPPAASSVREFVADFGKAKVRDVVVTEASLPLEKWVHVGAEVSPTQAKIYMDGNVVGQTELRAGLTYFGGEPEGAVADMFGPILLSGGDGSPGGGGVQAFSHFARLCPYGSVTDHFVKNPPLVLTLDGAVGGPSEDSFVEEEKDGVWSVVGGKASCRRNFSLDVMLSDALGRTVLKDLEIVAVLVFSDDGGVVQKLKDDAEAPLLATFDGVEFPSTDRPVRLVHGRASFKLKISQLSSKCENRLFRVRFEPLHVPPFPFLQALSRPICCVSRNRQRTGRKSSTPGGTPAFAPGYTPGMPGYSPAPADSGSGAVESSSYGAQMLPSPPPPPFAATSGAPMATPPFQVASSWTASSAAPATAPAPTVAAPGTGSFHPGIPVSTVGPRKAGLKRGRDSKGGAGSPGMGTNYTDDTSNVVAAKPAAATPGVPGVGAGAANGVGVPGAPGSVPGSAEPGKGEPPKKKQRTEGLSAGEEGNRDAESAAGANAGGAPGANLGPQSVPSGAGLGAPASTPPLGPPMSFPPFFPPSASSAAAGGAGSGGAAQTPMMPHFPFSPFFPPNVQFPHAYPGASTPAAGAGPGARAGAGTSSGRGAATAAGAMAGGGVPASGSAAGGSSTPAPFNASGFPQGIPNLASLQAFQQIPGMAQSTPQGALSSTPDMPGPPNTPASAATPAASIPAWGAGAGGGVGGDKGGAGGGGGGGAMGGREGGGHEGMGGGGLGGGLTPLPGLRTPLPDSPFFNPLAPLMPGMSQPGGPPLASGPLAGGFGANGTPEASIATATARKLMESAVSVMSGGGTQAGSNPQDGAGGGGGSTGAPGARPQIPASAVVPDRVVFRYCLESMACRSEFLKEAVACFSDAQLAGFASRVALCTGCEHNGRQILLAKRLLSEGAAVWRQLLQRAVPVVLNQGANSPGVRWPDVVASVEKALYKTIGTKTRRMDKRSREFLRRIAGLGTSLDLCRREEFEQLWMWVYPLGATLSQPLLRRAWEAPGPLALAGFLFRDEAEALLLQHSVDTRDKSGSFLVRFASSRLWPHPDAGALVVSFMDRGRCCHKLLCLDEGTIGLDAADAQQVSLLDLLLAQPELKRLCSPPWLTATLPAPLDPMAPSGLGSGAPWVAPPAAVPAAAPATAAATAAAVPAPAAATGQATGTAAGTTAGPAAGPAAGTPAGSAAGSAGGAFGSVTKVAQALPIPPVLPPAANGGTPAAGTTGSTAPGTAPSSTAMGVAPAVALNGAPGASSSKTQDAPQGPPATAPAAEAAVEANGA